MILVVLLSRRCHVNPDNVATPIAASLGDLTTLALLSGITCVLWKSIGEYSLGDFNQCGPVYRMLYGVTRPQWVNAIISVQRPSQT